MTGLHGLGPAFASTPALADLPTIAFYLKSVHGSACALAACSFIVWALPNTQEILGQTPHDHVRYPSLLPRLFWRPTAAWSLSLTSVLCMVLLMLDASTRFLYFQF